MSKETSKQMNDEIRVLGSDTEQPFQVVATAAFDFYQLYDLAKKKTKIYQSCSTTPQMLNSSIEK